MSTLYAYDPGGTTGTAWFDLDRDSKIARIIGWSETPLWQGIDKQIEDADEVVYERIVPRSLSFNPIGIEVQGVIRYLCEHKGIPCMNQSNSQIHGIQKWQKYDHLWIGIKSQHSKDALMHGIVLLLKRDYTVLNRDEQ